MVSITLFYEAVDGMQSMLRNVANSSIDAAIGFAVVH